MFSAAAGARRILVALTLAAGLCAGCSDSRPRSDALSPGDGRSEAAVPPDFRTGDGGRAGNVGDPCNPASKSGCTGQAECLEVGIGVGVCAIRGCTVEDLTTPAIEDNCPTIPSQADAGGRLKTVCTRVPVASKDGGTGSTSFCLPKCTPLNEQNYCQLVVNPALTCDPISLLQNGHSEVCMVPACARDSDCGNKNTVTPDSTCDTKTGICRVRGKAGVPAGAPCKSSTDCGAGQYCYPESKDKLGKVVVEGGYCTIVGCLHQGPWACPAASKCIVLGTAKAFSLCMATGCKVGAPAGADGCRDEAAAGQYSCTAQGTDGVCWLNVK